MYLIKSTRGGAVRFWNGRAASKWLLHASQAMTFNSYQEAAQYAVCLGRFDRGVTIGKVA